MVSCRWKYATDPDADGKRVVECLRCQSTMGPTAFPHERIHRRCKGPALPDDPSGLDFTVPHGLTNAEVKELLPDLSDPTLIGNRIAAVTTAIGIPPCAACDARKEWINLAHAWLRGD